MSSTLASTRRDAASASIQQLRLCLLDLTSRNPLISFDHGSRAASRIHVRAINATLDDAYSRLAEPGKAVPLRPLPPLAKGPADEASPAFQSALDVAKQTDTDYAQAMDALAPDAATAASVAKIERELRDKVRAGLGMPAAKDVLLRSLAEHAERHGIDPSFDLPLTKPAPAADGRQALSEIQTLHDPDELDRRLAKVRDAARLIAEETGVSALYTAWGFLEWYEADNSDRALTSPVLLLRTDLGRTINKSRFQYALEETGEDIQVNLTLSERLKRDFQVTLPDIQEEELPGAYLARVEQDICSGRPRWQIRRFVTLALFPFARLAMFDDLDEAQWAAAGGLADHPVVAELLGGSDSGGALFATEHDVDSEAVATVVPTLVLEADASQHSAIYEAMTGKNLVIEGPPGTGKSQTITNLIAAVLGSGKRVLFVAEKQTALQVVKDRLDKAGLGDFCLEIHSGKARKKDVVDALGQRLLRRGQPPVHGLESRRTELAIMKAQLTRYAEIMNQPFGAERRTIHETIWADRRRRQVETEQARRLDTISLPGAEHMADTDVDKLKALLTSYQRAAGAVMALAPRLDGHPWFGVKRSGLPATDIELAQRDMHDLAECLEQLRASAAPLMTTLDWTNQASIADVLAVSTALASVSISKAHSDRWHFALQDEARHAEAAEWLDRARSLRQTIAAAETLGIEVDALPPRDAVAAFLTDLPGARGTLPATLTAATLSAHAVSLRREADASVAVIEAGRRCSSSFGLSGELTARDLGVIVHLIDLIRGVDARVLACASPALLARGAPEALAVLAEALAMLRARQAVFEADYHLAKAPAPEDIRRHAEVLRTAGLLSFLSAPAKAAQQVFDRLRKASHKATKRQAADALAELADHLASVKTLQDDADVQRLLGRRWLGLATDIELAAACAGLGQALRSALVGYEEVTVQLRRVVADADEDRLRAIAALGDRAISDAVRHTLGRMVADTALSAELPGIIRDRAQGADDYAAASRAAGIPPGMAVMHHEATARHVLAVLDARAAAAPPSGLSEALGATLPDARSGDLAVLESGLNAARTAQRLNALPALRGCLARIGPATLMDDVVPAARSIETLARAAIERWDAVRERLQIETAEYFGAPFLGLPLISLVERCRHATAHRDALGAWVTYLLERDEGVFRGLGPLLDLWEQGLVTGSLAEAIERVFHRSLTREAYARYPELSRWSGLNQEQLRQRFEELDQQIVKLGRQDLVAKLLKTVIPPGNGVGKRSDYTNLVLIQNEIAKKTKHIAIRSLLDRAGTAIQAMKPCFMMSPLAVAQYMKPGALRFDLLVIDEASQMRPEDAVGAIARCDQMVVVGDPKQLAPTAFFARSDAVIDDDEADETIDAESVLDQALARFRPARRLRWHYRSRHGSLIAFSNREFYDNDLIVFPSPAAVGAGQGVSLTKVDGLYHARSNVIEAMAVCQAAVEHMRRRPDRSLGIATLNVPQKQLIADEMDRLSTTDSDVEAYMLRWNGSLERFFVKNLENVQGDERDSIFVSTVFGPTDPGGPVRQNFGPINKPNGHRRLNVLFTRAKHELRVFTSMTPDQIIANPDTPRGARVLRSYLTFAATGRLEAGNVTDREPDSDFEIFVADCLRKSGYDCAVQVGVAGFFLDIAVRDPARPDVFLLGVECDGATYHSSKSARDRDILRQQILEGLGWNIYRIWSTDWFRDPNGQTAQLLAHLARLGSSPSEASPPSGRVFA